MDYQTLLKAVIDSVQHAGERVHVIRRALVVPLEIALHSSVDAEVVLL